jgi:hypothetical protein
VTNPTESIPAKAATHDDALVVPLLRLLTTRERLAPQVCADWSDAQWRTALAMLAQHRLKPLLHWRLSHEHAHVIVAPWFREALDRSFRKATLRSLTLRADLHQVHRVLDAAHIPHIALKGPFLALHAYPHPALRPMRDLDVLVPMTSVLRAYEVLLGNGCARWPKAPGDPQSYLDGKKHLPPIFAPSGSTLLEVHGRLVLPDEVGQAAADALDEDAVWARRIAVAEAGETLGYMSPTDLLLHLIVHSAYDHRFDNGPLILSDVAALLQRHPIDWPLLWSLAATGGWTRGCQLLLRVVDRFHDLPDGVRVDARVDDAHSSAQLDALVDTTARLMLRDVSLRLDQQTLGAFDAAGGVVGRAGVFLRKVFPSRRDIAAQFPVDPNSPSVLFGYLRRWGYVTRRALEMRRGLKAASSQERRAQHAARLQVETLDRWLQSD